MFCSGRSETRKKIVVSINSEVEEFCRRAEGFQIEERSHQTFSFANGVLQTFKKLKWWKLLAPKLTRRLPMKYEDVAKMLPVFCLNLVKSYPRPPQKLWETDVLKPDLRRHRQQEL
jgi:hypothetical protein